VSLVLPEAQVRAPLRITDRSCWPSAGGASPVGLASLAPALPGRRRGHAPARPSLDRPAPSRESEQ